MEKIKAWSDIIGTWVTILGVFIGGAFALNEYLDKSKSERVKTTLEYVDKFNGSPLLGSRIHLDETWYLYAEQVFSKASDGDNPLRELILSTIKDHKLEHDTDALIDFVDTLRVCTCSALCDDDTVRNFFGKFAFDFHGLNYPYIQAQRQRMRDDSYGLAMEQLAKSYKSGTGFSDSFCKRSSPTK